MRAVVVVLAVLLLAAVAYTLAVGGVGALVSTKARKDRAEGAPGQFDRPDRTKP